LKAQAGYKSRAERVRKAAEEAGLACVLVVPGPNMRYFTGVSSFLLERTFLLLIPSEGEPRLVAPAIEAGPYAESPLDISIYAWTDSEGPGGALARAVRGLGSGSWGVEGRAPFQYLSVLKKYTGAELEDAEPILQGLRAIKGDDEVTLMKRSAKILSETIEEAPALVEVGASELDLAGRLMEFIRSKGGSTPPDLLVQSGVRSADPHCTASKKRIKSGDAIVLDLVSSFEGYHSDITRTICAGSSKRLEDVYEKVLEAQSRAISAAAEDVPVGAVDKAAREYLESRGLGKHFTHRTGHGLGLEEHEAPYIVEGGEERLKENMFFTVEPGAYIAGKLGVRIEDDIMISGGKAVEITNPPKQYGWWK